MNEFISAFKDFSRHESLMKNFDNLLVLILCIFAHGREEERYLKTIEQYSREKINRATELFARLTILYCTGVTKEGGWTDPLGEFYMEFANEKGKQMSGQFFTPESVCDMMAVMTKSPIPEYGNFAICDPAVGSGRTLLAASRLSPQHNYRGRFFGVDIDRICAMMCAINMFYHGLTGTVIHGDSIAVKAWGGWRVRPLLGRIDWLSADAAQAFFYTQEYEKAIEVEPQQLQLFS